MVAATSMLQLGLALLVSGQRLGAWQRSTPTAQASGFICRRLDSIEIRYRLTHIFVLHTSSLAAAAQVQKKPKAGKQAKKSQPATAGKRYAIFDFFDFDSIPTDVFFVVF